MNRRELPPWTFEERYDWYRARGMHRLVATILAHQDVTTYWPSIPTTFQWRIGDNHVRV